MIMRKVGDSWHKLFQGCRLRLSELADLARLGTPMLLVWVAVSEDLAHTLLWLRALAIAVHAQPGLYSFHQYVAESRWTKYSPLFSH